MPDSVSSAGVAIALKFLVACAGTILLALGARRQGDPSAPPAPRWHDLALMTLAAMAFVGWWNFGRFNSGTFIHSHEFYHYYLGAKYAAELEYTRLYDCSAAVEALEGRTAGLETRWVRDLRDNRMREGSPAASDPSLCTARFSDARWQEFTHDVLFFKGRMSKAKWAQAQGDHGYNATPVWGIAGKVFSTTGPITRRTLFLLALIDPVLLIVMWAVVWWAFGWRTMAVALLYWGTNYPARYNFIGGAFLREDWLLFGVASIALAARGRLATAGGALGVSTLLRIFPGFISVGPALQLLQRGGGHARAVWRVAAGAIAAVAILVPLSWFALDGGVRPGIARWQAFAENSRKHLSGASVNRVSLKSAITFDPDARMGDLADFWVEGPGDAWQAARRSAFERRRGLYWALVLAFVVALARAVRDAPTWAAMVLGVGLIPFAADITCYYYGILLVYAFLSPRRPWIGVGLVALSALTCLAASIWSADEDRYVAISVLVLLYTAVVTVYMARTRGVSRESSAI